MKRPSAIRAIFVVLATEMHRRLADRSIIISSFVAPAVIAAIIGFAFGNAGPSPHVDLGVAIINPTPAAERTVEAGIKAAGFASEVDVIRFATPADMRRQVSSGALGAGVIVPSGFASAESFGLPTKPTEKPTALDTSDSPLPGLFADVTFDSGNGPPGARLTVVSPSSSTLGGQLGIALASAISSRLYAGALDVKLAAVASPGTPGGVAALLSQAQSAATRPVSLQILNLDIGTNHSVIGYYGSSIAVVFLFIGAGLGTRAIAMERSGGTLTRLAAAPVSSTWIVVGKMAAVFVTAVVGLLVLWAETVILFKASWGNAAGVVLMCAAVSLAMCSLAMFLTSLAKDEAQAYAASIIVGIVLGIVGGNFFPPGALPGPLQDVSLATPNGWALVGFGRLALTNATIPDLVGPLVVLGIISLVFISAASIRIRRVVEL
ncbi:MAG: ABC transporter permease [Acidimicrobiales bacterium]